MTEMTTNQYQPNMHIPKFGDHRLFIYDFETSGFWNDKDVKERGVPLNQPIQVSIIIRELNGTHNYYSSYIKCPFDIDPDAAEATDITDELLRKVGEPIEEVFAEINKRLTVPDTLVIGHNTIEFDNKFLNHYLQKFGYDPIPTGWAYDTLGQFKGHMLQRAKVEAETYETYHWDLIYKGGWTVDSNLEDVCKYYGIPTRDDFHDAVPDAGYTYEIFKEQFKDPLNLLPIKNDGSLTPKNARFAEKVTRGTYRYMPRGSYKWNAPRHR